MDVGWRERLSDMEAWYDDFLASDAQEAERSLLWEYQPYADRLSLFDGRVLDVGGGAGLAGRFLPPEAEYWVIDPSETWTGSKWREFSKRFTGREFHFVHGIGERLPFHDCEFDGVLSFWSLNHVQSPAQCMREMHRVLKSAGKCLIVLEDMKPSLTDVLRLWLQEQRQGLGKVTPYPMSWNQSEIGSAKETFWHLVTRKPWPLQEDHIRITERFLKSLLPGQFRMADRNWEGGFLSWELERI